MDTFFTEQWWVRPAVWGQPGNEGNEGCSGLARQSQIDKTTAKFLQVIMATEPDLARGGGVREEILKKKLLPLGHCPKGGGGSNPNPKVLG